MIKKIPVEQLQPGMHIHDLNCSWMEHTFLRGSFKVKGEKEVRKILAHGIREVYIDTGKGLDTVDGRSETEVCADLDQEMIEVAIQAKPAKAVSLREEFARARNIHATANEIVRNVLQDVRLGKQLELEQIEPVVERITGSIFRNKDALINLGRIKQKDDYTFQHSVSMCTLLISFCRALDMEHETIRLVGVGGLLHDIGKMRVPSEILNKPGKLNEQEFAVMKSHVVHSREILMKTPGIAQASIDVAAQHHERHDGSGYPRGLKGADMSLYGQMAAIVDVYDALTSDRCYHQGMQPTEALRKLLEWSKFHFNPGLIHAFIRSIGIYPVGTLVQLESGMLAVVVEQREKSLLQPLVRAIFNTRKGHYITPQEIDLSKPLGRGGGDRITRHESPEKWRIEMTKFL